MKIKYPCTCVMYNKSGTVLWVLEKEGDVPFSLSRNRDKIGFHKVDTSVLFDALEEIEMGNERFDKDECLEFAAILSLLLDSLPQEIWESFGNTPVVKLPEQFCSKLGLNTELINIEDFILKFI